MLFGVPTPDPAPGTHGKVTVVPITLIVPAKDQFGHIIPGYRFRCHFYVNGHHKCVLLKHKP